MAKIERVINITGNPLTVIDEYGHTLKIQSYGQTRVRSNLQVREVVELPNPAGDMVKIPILVPNDQEVEGIPEPEEGTLFVVAGLVAAIANREDVVAPSRVIREGRKITECRAFLLPNQR